MVTRGKKKRVLLVDDTPLNIGLLKGLCEELGYDTIEATNGQEAVEKSLKERPDLILMDILMPGMDGFTATERIKNDKRTARIPIIIVTMLDSRQDAIKGISKGADDFLTRPVDMEELALKLRNHLKLKEYVDLIEKQRDVLEEKVKERTEELKNTLEELDRMHSMLKQGYIETVYRLATAAEYKDKYAGAHLKRMSAYAQFIAEELHMDRVFVNTISYAAPMHDIGMVGISDDILDKDGPLTPKEWDVMKSHAKIGARILSGSKSPFLQMAYDIAQFHHERWDGTGYPEGLKGAAIPVAARIVNITDQYDALRSKRPYKSALAHEVVCKIITEGDGRTMPAHFDPAVLEIFKKNHQKFNEIYKELEI